MQVSAAQALSSLSANTSGAPITSSLTLAAGTFVITSDSQSYIDITSWPPGSSLVISGAGSSKTFITCSGNTQMLGSPLHINSGAGVNITLANMTLSHCNTTDGALRIIADATFFGFGGLSAGAASSGDSSTSGLSSTNSTGDDTSTTTPTSNTSSNSTAPAAAAPAPPSLHPVGILLQELQLSNNTGAPYGSALQIDVIGAPGYIAMQDTQIEGNCGAYARVSAVAVQAIEMSALLDRALFDRATP
jgi:hypothetical protein